MRKVQLPSGRWMTQEANADTPKGDGKPPTARFGSSAGVNGIVVDPRDARALAEAMRRAADPQTARALREGVQRMNAPLRPDAATEVILKAVTLAREGSRTARK